MNEWIKKRKLKRIRFKPMFLLSSLTYEDSYNIQIIQSVKDTIFRNGSWIMDIPGFGTGSGTLEPVPWNRFLLLTSNHYFEGQSDSWTGASQQNATLTDCTTPQRNTCISCERTLKRNNELIYIRHLRYKNWRRHPTQTQSPSFSSRTQSQLGLSVFWADLFIYILRCVFIR